jgi:hypothetical protein
MKMEKLSQLQTKPTYALARTNTFTSDNNNNNNMTVIEDSLELTMMALFTLSFTNSLKLMGIHTEKTNK